MPRQNRGGGQGQNQPHQPIHLSIQDFVFAGPRSSATINFRVLRGKNPVPNVPAMFVLGLNNIKYLRALVKGGTGPDANDPWIINTGNNGVGFSEKVDLSGFSYKDYNKITIQVPGADDQTIEMDSESAIPTASVKSSKVKRLKAFYNGQELSSGCICEGVKNQYTVRFQTYGSDGKFNPEQIVVLSENGKFGVSSEGGQTLATNVPHYTFTTLDSPIKGMLMLTFSFIGARRTFSFVHPGTGETITITFHTK